LLNSLLYRDLCEAQFRFRERMLSPGWNEKIIAYYHGMTRHEHSFIIIGGYEFARHFTGSQINRHAVSITALPEIGDTFYTIPIIRIHIVTGVVVEQQDQIIIIDH
jgi:hypothetical protein